MSVFWGPQKSSEPWPTENDFWRKEFPKNCQGQITAKGLENVACPKGVGEMGASKYVNGGMAGAEAALAGAMIEDAVRFPRWQLTRGVVQEQSLEK